MVSTHISVSFCPSSSQTRANDGLRDSDRRRGIVAIVSLEQKEVQRALSMAERVTLQIQQKCERGNSALRYRAFLMQVSSLSHLVEVGKYLKTEIIERH